MTKTKAGIKVNVTNSMHGMLEHGGVSNRVVLVMWGAVSGLLPETKLSAPYNDLYTYGDVVRDVAYGRWGDQSKVKVLRKGRRIR